MVLGSGQLPAKQKSWLLENCSGMSAKRTFEECHALTQHKLCQLLQHFSGGAVSTLMLDSTLGICAAVLLLHTLQARDLGISAAAAAAAILAAAESPIPSKRRRSRSPCPLWVRAHAGRPHLVHCM